jgi:hypothetical protein
MEINGTPYNKEKSTDSIKWIRCEVSQSQDTLEVTMIAKSEDKDPHYIYMVEFDKQSYVELQKA